MSELILVVDDEADIRDLLVFNLKREGYETVEASDGMNALAGDLNICSRRGLSL